MRHKYQSECYPLESNAMRNVRITFQRIGKQQLLRAYPGKLNSTKHIVTKTNVRGFLHCIGKSEQKIIYCH